jgi:transposase-like protein
VANKRYPKAFRQMAVERMKRCDNIVVLSEKLGVHRRLLYTWRDKLDPVDMFTIASHNQYLICSLTALWKEVYNHLSI